VQYCAGSFFGDMLKAAGVRLVVLNAIPFLSPKGRKVGTYSPLEAVNTTASNLSGNFCSKDLVSKSKPKLSTFFHL
jgi:hypothetical protein